MSRRAVSPGHALPVATRTADQRRSPVIVELQPGRRQLVAAGRSRKCRHGCGGWQPAAARADLREPTAIRLAVGVLRAGVDPQFRPATACGDARYAVCRGFRRYLRSARTAAPPARQRVGRNCVARHGGAALSGAGSGRARHRALFRAGPRPARQQQRKLHPGSSTGQMVSAGAADPLQPARP